MTILNLTPVLDALTGTAVTAASFKAVAMRAGRTAVRVDGATVTFPTELTATWDGTGWDVTPTLYPLPVDCYWKVRVAAAEARLERNVVLPNGNAAVAFGDLIAVTPDTGQVDTSTISQFQATQQFVSNQVAQVGATAATIFGTVATVQAQIDTATQAAAASAAAAAAAEAAQASLADELTTVTDSAAAAAASATEAAGAASTAGAAASTATAASSSASSAAIAAATDRTAIETAIADFLATSIDGNN
jgi:hypothetical protein